MTLDEAILAEARSTREVVLELERQQAHAKVEYQHQIRRLHAAGGSLREIADALGLSHQRVHQIVGEQAPSPLPIAPRPVVRKARERRGTGMFARFTGEARAVVTAAQEEGRALKHNYIGTEHVLLGLLSDEATVAARALAGLGVTHTAVRAAVEREVGLGEGPAAGHMPFTKRAKKLLESALREALALGDNYIGPEHVLLGLVRDGKSLASRILAELGADAEQVREAVDHVAAAER